MKEVNNIKSVYIHIPFCKKICTYCDFCKMYYNESLVDKYLNSLYQEIKNNYKKEKLNTIYIGGGTPSLLKKTQLLHLFEIINIFSLNKSYEFTFECNIEDITKELLQILKNNRVNRISIGVESFNKDLLKVLGREYNFNINEKLSLVKKYFSNINIDLIYGIKDETIDILNEDLDKFLKQDIPHISIYALILEDNTILKINNYQEIDDELSRRMYDIIRKKLKNNNYLHYEISNFSKKGYKSKHNLVYWNNLEYYGFGLGASGYVNNIRYTNTRSINNYLNGLYRYEAHFINLNEQMENEMILGLRKIKGVSKKRFFKKYNKKIEEVFNVKRLNQNQNNYYVSTNFLYVSNYILSDFIDIE